MQCPTCSDDMTAQHTDLCMCDLPTPLKIAGVPVWVCDTCDSEVFDPAVAHRIGALRDESDGGDLVEPLRVVWYDRAEGERRRAEAAHASTRHHVMFAVHRLPDVGTAWRSVGMSDPMLRHSTATREQPYVVSVSLH